MALKLSCARRIKKKRADYSSTLNVPVGAIFRNDVSYWGFVVTESRSLFVLHLGMLCLVVWMWLCNRSQIWTTLPIKENFLLEIQRNLDLHFCTIICWLWVLFIDLNSVSRKGFFFCFKKGHKAAAKAINASMKNRWSWKWDKRLELSFGPIKHQIRDCI